MCQYQIELVDVWASAWLVIVTINAWLAFCLGARPSVEAVSCMIFAEGLFTLLAFLAVLIVAVEYKSQLNYVRGFVVGLLGLEVAILALMFFVPPPAQTDPVVISFYFFAFFWPGFAFGMV